MLVKSMPLVAEFHDAKCIGSAVAQVTVPVPLSGEELVAALWSALPVDEDPHTLPAGQIEAAVVYALTFQGLHQVREESFRLAQGPPDDPDARRFLAGCRARAQELLAAWSQPSLPARSLVGVAA